MTILYSYDYKGYTVKVHKCPKLYRANIYFPIGSKKLVKYAQGDTVKRCEVKANRWIEKNQDDK